MDGSGECEGQCHRSRDFESLWGDHTGDNLTCRRALLMVCGGTGEGGSYPVKPCLELGQGCLQVSA